MREGDIPPVPEVRIVETVTLPHGPQACRMARAWAAEHLAALSIKETVVEDVVLCLDEIVSNVITHTLSAPVITLTINGGVLVEVADASRATAALRNHADAPGGWGLRIVDNIADRWGSDVKGTGGKVVWFTVTA